VVPTDGLFGKLLGIFYPMLILSDKANLSTNHELSASNADIVPDACTGISRKKYSL
jgi:hypothetical protein